MKILLVSIGTEFPLANYCLGAQILATSDLNNCQVEIINLDWGKLSSFDRKNSEIWNFLGLVDKHKPQIIGFSTYIWNHLIVKELVEITIKLFSSIYIVIGGPEVQTREYSESWIRNKTNTVVVRGEGETTFVATIRRIIAKESFLGVKGLSWFHQGEIIHELDSDPQRDLSLFASPFLTGLIPDNAFESVEYPYGKSLYSRALIQSYRGCYMACSYCQWGDGTKRRYAFSLDRTKKELSWLLSKKVNSIFIIDAMFGFKKADAEALLSHIISENKKHNSNPKISLYHNQDFYDPQLMELYREANAYVEVDLQSTNYEVLTKTGRQKWYISSFDKHREAFNFHRVNTTGSADLIIGLPGDNLTSFEESVDFMLRRGLRINLFQGLILPGTGWEQTANETSTIYSPIPPRAVYENETFPLSDVISARSIGHGVDFFNRFPKTAHYLWRQKFDGPVDLCKFIANLMIEKHGAVYEEDHWQESALDPKEANLIAIIGDLIQDEVELNFIHQLITFEVNYSKIAIERFGGRVTKRIAPSDSSLKIHPRDWMNLTPRFLSDRCDTLKLASRIDKYIEEWDKIGKIPSSHNIPSEGVTVFFYYNEHPRYLSVIDDELVKLLFRMNGYFTIKDCLSNIQFDFGNTDRLEEVLDGLEMFIKNGLVVVVD